jgi:hypothetical protein
VLSGYAAAFDAAPLPLQSLFLYAVHRVDPAELDPVAAPGMNLRARRALLWSRPKEMWSAASMLHAAGRQCACRFVTQPEVPGVRRFEREGPGYESFMNARIREVFAVFPNRYRKP